MNGQQNPQYPRYIERKVIKAMTDTRVVSIVGPRQAGKTTLAQKLSGENRPYLTLDDESIFQIAHADPIAFIRQFEFVTIDEIQRAPELIREIKRSVDTDQRPGRFVLTGSANILTISTVSESLAGRMAINELFPLAQAEIEGQEYNQIDQLFESRPAMYSSRPLDTYDLTRRILASGYPEMLMRSDSGRRRAWADDYIRTLLSRDIREVMNAYRLTDLKALLKTAAIQSAQLIVYSQLAKSLKLSIPTVQKYINTLEQMYLIRLLPAWSRNSLKRLVRTPKLHFIDAGLLAVLRAIAPDRLSQDRSLLGPLLESFVFSELLKLASFSEHAYDFFYYRDKDKVEVDFVVERPPDGLIGIEVKASATIRNEDWRGLKRLESVAGSDFTGGIIFYTGDHALAFGNNLQALPVSMLWNG
ncbi:MAG: ATP-binding protein [Aestuariivita sp.]|nr:ATP-binding protein [Aestuariivita sp.]MCY4204089.1 ATP-binding protein [Aestuariivita sp.]MCY4346101.1 ATP-binding protein [Aestuariivita sp.]